MNISRSITAVVAAASWSFAAVAGAQTINFGDNLPGGPIAPGYAGFQWGSGANQAFNYTSDSSDPNYLLLTAPAAQIFEFSRSSLFDLNSVDYQELVSLESYEDTINDYSVIVSGYRGNTLVKSVTENFPGFPSASFSGLNIDGVDKVTFTTIDTAGYIDLDTGKDILNGSIKYAGAFVDQLKVSNYNAAPEIDSASAVSSLTLLLGSLLVLRGRRAHS
jgi:hypothetical protein